MVNHPSAERTLLGNDEHVQAMDPGHVDFVLYVSEELDLTESHISNAMPVSKRLGFGVLALGLLMLLIGLGVLSNNLLAASAAVLSADKIIGLGMLIVGSLLIAIVTRSFLLFLHEVLELTD